MPPKQTPSLRFSDVAFGIDITPKALRNWLVREQVELVSQEPESGWRQFEIADVAILALVRHMTPLGIQVPMASRIAWTILEMMNGKEWGRLTTSQDMPDLIGAGWSKSYVVLHPNTDDDDEPTGWSVEIRQGWQKYNRMPAAVYLTIAPEAILRRAINRAVTGEEYEPDADTLYFNQRFEDREEISREIERTGSLPDGALLTGPAVLTEERRRSAEDELEKLKGILAKDKGEASE